MGLPSLSRRELEHFLQAFAREWCKDGDFYHGMNRNGDSFTIHYPHPQKPWPDVVRKWLGYLGVGRAEFDAWWQKQ